MRTWPNPRRRFGEILPPRMRDFIAQREREKHAGRKTSPDGRCLEGSALLVSAAPGSRPARGARRVATLIRSFASPNTRHLYGEWAARLDAEAEKILERVATYTGKASTEPKRFSAKGAGVAALIPGERE